MTTFSFETRIWRNFVIFVILIEKFRQRRHDDQNVILVLLGATPGENICS